LTVNIQNVQYESHTPSNNPACSGPCEEPTQSSHGAVACSMATLRITGPHVALPDYELFLTTSMSRTPFILPHLLDVKVSALRNMVAGRRFDARRSNGLLTGRAALPAERYKHIPLLSRIWESRRCSAACGSMWCILPLKEFTFHPFGSMARAGTRAIIVCNHGVRQNQVPGDAPRSYLD
jgi:hypothetical protein